MVARDYSEMAYINLLQLEDVKPPTFSDSLEITHSMYMNTTTDVSLIAKSSDINRRKRRASFQTGSYDEDDTDDKSTKTNNGNKKQNHSEIEKRRRDKMNTYITELTAMIPMCHAMSRKLDKLTVLRMAVQHLKTVRGAVHSYTEGHYKPAFLSDRELKMLILQAADGFLFAVGCDRGRILYVSESVSQILNYTKSELLGQSWFDILHPKDVAKVKEQLSSSDLSPRDRLIDAKTMLPVKTDFPQGVSRLCPGARRSFFCRMKCKFSTTIKEETENHSTSHGKKKQKVSERKYSVIQCTGYLKSWAPAKLGLEEQEGEGDSEAYSLSCLVAVGRIQPPICTVAPPNSISSPNIRTIEFISRHAMDGKFLFVDQRSTLVLGFLPQELLGTSMYEYYHHEEIKSLAETHKLALLSPTIVKTTPYRLKTKDGSFIRIQSEWKSFRNPWTKDVEYLIAKNSVMLTDIRQYENSINNQLVTNYDYFNQSPGRDMQRLINTHVESSKIGCQIAEEVLESQRREELSAGSSPDPIIPDVTLTGNEQLILNLPSSVECTTPQSNSTITSQHNGTLPAFDQVRINNNIAAKSDQSGSADEEMMEMISSVVLPDSAIQVNSTDGNDEAAMAVIMSFLEADAGLGGPVDFSGLPWPLP